MAALQSKSLYFWGTEEKKTEKNTPASVKTHSDILIDIPILSS
jgi:hypothetical protein